MSFPGYSCLSIMIICSQPQTYGASGRERGCGNGVSPVLSLLPTVFTVKCSFL